MNATVSSSPAGALRLFVLAAAAAAAWIAFNLAFPEAGAAVRYANINRIAANIIILAGLWLALARAGFTDRERITLWLVIAVPFTLWLALIWGLAVNDFFRPIPGVPQVPPRLPVAIFLPLLVALPLLMVRSRRVAALIDATPAAWLIGIQAFRIFGGTFLVGWMQGDLPGAFALPAGIGDITVGVLALPAALAVASGTAAGRTIGVAWNLLGLTDFAIAVATGVMTSPGPLHVLALDHPNLQTGVYPSVMIPAFAVPSWIILHALSLWQLRRAARRPVGLEVALATG
jgi:hypothetical protein